ncbi:MAG: single-stranded-DNA-specific exonuclease RecJ [Bacteroidetes bacterium]|nr:MAG: single-stranded-DNA-specific exonuclease RecJ [Bacteroidota bacterium]
MHTYRWELCHVDRPERVAALQTALNDLPEALARCLVLRGIDSLEAARRFFRPALKHLHDPFLMQDMTAAAERVARAVRRRERVLVYGDYDVDGTSATALMTTFLRRQGLDVDYFIPNRFTDGYGLGRAGIDAAAEQGAALIIALDCGITATEEADYARARGLDLIICDHHTAHDALPRAVAVLDPKRPDCAYPFKELSGCGVGFKLVQATLTTLGRDPDEAMDLLDLVAVSIASDIVPVVGENRLLMQEGLRRLAERPRPGLRALAQQAGLDLAAVSTERIVFGLGPRINAAGRLGDAAEAVELLLTDDPARADELAKKLEAINEQRRRIDLQTRDEAIEQAKRHLSGRMRHALVLHKADWHQGVIGIVASRVLERYHRPTVMLCTVDGAAKGSARSIDGLNIFEALQSCADLLTRFGGHAHAAGLTLPVENISAFRDRLDDVVEAAMTPDMLIPTKSYDAGLHLADIDGRFWAVLRQFAPHGPGNLTPVFRGTNLQVAGEPRLVGTDQRHLRFAVRQSSPDGDVCLPVIGFDLHRHLPLLQQSRRQGRPFEMLFSINENTWRGRTTLQLQARDLRPADA